MSLVKELLMDKKILEAVEEVDEILEKAGVEEGSLVQSLEFDKSVFSDKDQVHDFLENHFLDAFKIEDEEKKYKVNLFSVEGFIESTLKTIKIRDGISMVVGVIKPMSSDNPFFFSLPGGDNIKLSSDLPYVIELANVVKGFHQNFGEVEITKKDLQSFKDNFDNEVVGVDISIDFDHEVREAAGWLKEVFLSEDGNSLFGVVRWTPKGALSLNDREFRYFSPEFHPNWVHPHTGVAHGPTLLGGALVNRPFLKLDAIVGLKRKSNGGLTVETIAMSEHKSKVNDLEKQIIDLKLSEGTAKNKVTTLEDENKKLTDEVKTLKDSAAKRDKEALHQKLFDGGKINKAQLTALNEGKPMLEVLSLSEKMNTEPNGNTGADNAGVVTLSDKEAKMCKALGLTPEDYVKYNSEETQ